MPIQHQFKRALYAENCRCGAPEVSTIHTDHEPAPAPTSDQAESTPPLSGWAGNDAELKAFKANLLAGIGPDAPKVTNDMGGQQSKLDYRFDLLDPAAMFALASVLHYGVNVRGYPANNWRAISVDENLNHAMMHILAHLQGDTQDQHLEHAFTRMMFALGVHLQGGPKPQ